MWVISWLKLLPTINQEGIYDTGFNTKVGTALFIGNKITIRVLRIHFCGVRLGVIAPRDVLVYRQEVYWRVLKERKAMARRIRRCMGLRLR